MSPFLHFFHRRFERHMHHVHPHHGGRFSARGPKMFDAGALRYVVLQLIAEQPRHGYDIIKEIEQRAGGVYAPSPGVIYPLLAMLEDLGHVVVTADGAKKLHTITPEGQAFLDENRGFVKGIFARMSGSAHRHGHGRHHGDLREALHDVKIAVVSRVRGEGLSDEQLQAIQAILTRAAEEIRHLE